MHQSSSTKKSHLWNVQQPGDPYDIRKSMIARLPNHPPKPMGEHLELICLLQAAQIQRLSEYLRQIQCKYREVEKKELDRHSYQIQIKELAQRNISYTNLKAENDRLKDFIRRQTIELEQLQKKNMQTMNMEALNAKYQNVLSELGMAREHSQRSEQTISRLNIELTEWKQKYERVELEKLNLKSQFDMQINQRISIQIRKALSQAEQRNNRLQLEFNQTRDNLDNKNHELQMLLSQKEQLLRELRQMEDKFRTQNNLQMTLSQKNRQIQRLNSIVDDLSYKFEQAQASSQRLGGELKVIEEKYFNLQKERETLMSRVREAELSESRRSELDKYEERVAMMSMEIERLNNLSVSRNRQQQQTRSELDRLRNQVNQLRAERDQLKRNQVDLSKLAAHQSKISLLSQELQRVTYELQQKKEEVRQLQYKFSASESSASQVTILATEKGRLEQELHASRTELRNYKSITDSQLNNLRSQCSKLRQDIDQQTGSRAELQKYRLQCQGLRSELERVRNQSISYRRTFDEQKVSIERLTVQLNKSSEERTYLSQQNSRLGAEISHLRRDSDQMKGFSKQVEQKNNLIRNLQLDLEAKSSRNSQIQITIQNVYKEIQRLHTVLASKTNQLMKLAKDYSQLEEKFRQQDRIISEHVKEKQVLERKLIDLQRQLAQRVPFQQQVSKDYERVIQQNKNKDTLIQRLQSTIQQLQSQFRGQENRARQLESRAKEWETRFRDTQRLIIIKQQEKQNLSQELSRLSAEVSSSKYRKDEEQKLRQKVDSLTQQNLKLRMKIDDLQRSRHSADSDIRLQLKRAEETITFERNEAETLRQHIQRLNRETESQREKIKEYQQKIVHIENTNSKVLQQRLRQKEISIQDKQALIASLQQQLRSLEIQFGQYVDKDRSTITNLTQYENKIALLSTEFERLNQLVQDKNREVRERDHTIQQLRGQLNQLKKNISDSRNNKDQQFIIQLKSQIDQLSRNAQEQDRVIQQLRSREPSSQADHSYCNIEITNLKAALEELENINLHTIAQRDELFKVSHQIKAEYDENLARLLQQEKQIRNELQYRLDENRSRGEELGSLRKKEQSYLAQISQLQALGRQEDPNLKRRLAQFEQQNISYSHSIQQLRIQNTNLRTEISQLQLMIQELRARGENREEIGSLRVKINEYVELLAGKDEDLLEWENKYTGLYTAYEQLYSNYNLTKSEYQVTITNIKVYQSKLFQLQEDFSALSEALRNTKRQLERYENQNYQLQTKLQGDGDLYQKNILLSQQIDRLNVLTTQMQQDLAQTRIHLTDGVSLNKRIQEHLGLFVVLFAEIQSLRNRLANSEKECEDVRRSSLVPLRVDKSMGPRP